MIGSGKTVCDKFNAVSFHLDTEQFLLRLSKCRVKKYFLYLLIVIKLKPLNI